MELVDIYDEKGEFTGKSKARGEALLEGEYIKAVGIWVFTPENKILLTRRSPEKTFAPGMWENTGGHVEHGEESLQAVLRELWEETGLRAEPQAVEHLGTARVDHYFGENYSVRAEVDVKKLRLQPGETCDAKLVTYEEFLQMAEKGELAPSVLSHLEGYREAFLRSLGEPDRAD